MASEWPCLPAMCACVELWKAVMIMGLSNVVYSAWMVGVYSYATHMELGSTPILRNAVSYQTTIQLCVAFYCLEIIFNCILVYGAYKRITSCLRVFFYYVLTVSLGSLMLQAAHFFTMTDRHMDYLLISHALFGTGVQIYLLFMVRSLLSRFDQTSHRELENQLEEVTTTEWPGPGGAAGVVGTSNTSDFVEVPIEPRQNLLNVPSLVTFNRARNGDQKPILGEDISY